MSEKDYGSVSDIVSYKLGRADEDYLAAKQLYNLKSYKAANNRAYYTFFQVCGCSPALPPRTFFPFNISQEKLSIGCLDTRKLPARWVSCAKLTA